jgi:mRNA interferase HigB
LALCQLLSNFEPVNIIKRKAILDFCFNHPDARTALNTWFAVCRKADWTTYHELQQDFPEAFPVGDNRVVFDIKGNRYRLVARVLFTYKQVQIKWIGTHREYDRIDVKTVKKY